MKLINTTPIEQLGGFSYSCDCGARHTINTTDIIFRENALCELSVLAEKYAGKGAKLLVVYSSRSSRLKEKIGGILSGFEVISETLDLKFADTKYVNGFLSLPEDVRVIIGVGGGSLADTVKYIATALQRNYILIPDVVRCDAFLSPSAVLYNSGFKEIYKINPPNALIADYEILLDMSESSIAAAFGSIMGKYISLFDWKIANIIGNEKFCGTIAELSTALIDECMETAERARRREKPALVKLIELNLRSGLYMQLAGSSRLSCGGETQVEHTLEMLFINEERDLKGYGENIMLCTAFLTKVYRLALEREFGGLLLPPDNNLRADCISDYLGADSTKAVMKVRPLLDENILKARRHKLKEYKEELLLEICETEQKVLKGYKFFKRLYDDAGYSLVQYLDPADFKVAMPLAPDIREKFTLLTMLKDMGLLDSYLV